MFHQDVDILNVSKKSCYTNSGSGAYFVIGFLCIKHEFASIKTYLIFARSDENLQRLRVPGKRKIRLTKFSLSCPRDFPSYMEDKERFWNSFSYVQIYMLYYTTLD